VLNAAALVAQQPGTFFKSSDPKALELRELTERRAR
jgi:hypothetical protein